MQKSSIDSKNISNLYEEIINEMMSANVTGPPTSPFESIPIENQDTYATGTTVLPAPLGAKKKGKRKGKRKVLIQRRPL
jgi:hypothetical protein